MSRTPKVTMDNRAGTSVIVRILPGPEDVLDGDLTAVSTPSEASLPDDLKIALVSTWPSFQAVHARSISHHSASQQIGLGVVNRPARGRVLGLWATRDLETR